MNTFKRYMALAATAIIFTASLPLGAMKQPDEKEVDETKENKKRKRELSEENPEEIKKRKQGEKTLTSPSCENVWKCPICLELIDENETEEPIVALPCDKKNKISHDFHIECLSDFVKTCKKNLKTTFPCPCCRKEYKATTILSQEEIEKIEYSNTLIHNAATGNLAAAKEIIENHDLVSDEDLATIFIRASKNDKNHKIIKLFMANNAIMNKVGTTNATKAFIETICHGSIKNFEEFIKNEALFKKLEQDDYLKNIWIAIYKGDTTSFYSIFTNIYFMYIESYKNPTTYDDVSIDILTQLVSIIAFSAISTSTLIRKLFSSNPLMVEKINTRTLGSILIHAIKKGYNDIVQEFFSKNHIMKISNNDLGFILAYAGKKNNLIVIQNFLNPQNKKLLEKIEKNDIGTAMMNAAKHGHLESIKIFFESDYILKEIDREDCKKMQNMTKNEEVKKFIETKMPPKTWEQSTACYIQ